MSLSKLVRRCNYCGCRATIRHFHSQNRLSVPALHPQDGKMSATPHWRGFSLNQWRQLKDQLIKLQSEGMFILNKEWSSILQKLPGMTPVKSTRRDVVKRFHPYSSEAKDKAEIKHQLVEKSVNKPTHPLQPTIEPNKSSTIIKTSSTITTSPRDSDSLTDTATSNSSEGVAPAATAPLATEEAGYKYLQVLTDLNWRIATGFDRATATSKAIKAKWRTHEHTITKSSISSRTRFLISALLSASTRDSKVKRLEGLLQHLYQYPEARGYAVKEGAVSFLLRQRHVTNDIEILGHVREALCLLGYVDPPKGRGIRVLSIDGGGIRGVLAIKLMMKLEELTKKPVYELFDYVCGVSTGAIIACAIFAHKKNLDEVLMHYKELSQQVFNENVLWGTRRLMWNHSYYDTSKWEAMLQKFIGSTKMIQTSRDGSCPKISAISTVVNREKVNSFVFRNYELRHSIQSQYQGSSEYSLWEAVRASSSAPTYFQEFPLGDLLHQDGGIMANNPCGVAIHEALLLWPGVPLECVVSFGTGRCATNMSIKSDDKAAVPTMSSWSNKFVKILESATDTEAVHTILNDLMPGNKYYRFNPYLTEMLNMTETRPDKVSQLEMDAEMYYRRNEEKFREAAKILVEPRTTSQKITDWLSLQANMHGLKANL